MLSHALSRPHAGCLPLIKHSSLLHPHSSRSSPVNWTGQRQVGHATRGWQLGRWNALAWIVCQTKFLGKPSQSAMPRRSCWKNPRALPFFTSLRVSLVDSAQLPDDHVLRLSVMLQSCKILLPSMLSEVSPTFWMTENRFFTSFSSTGTWTRCMISQRCTSSRGRLNQHFRRKTHYMQMCRS